VVEQDYCLLMPPYSVFCSTWRFPPTPFLSGSRLDSFESLGRYSAIIALPFDLKQVGKVPVVLPVP